MGFLIFRKVQNYLLIENQGNQKIFFIQFGRPSQLSPIPLILPLPPTPHPSLQVRLSKHKRQSNIPKLLFVGPDAYISLKYFTLRVWNNNTARGLQAVGFLNKAPVCSTYFAVKQFYSIIKTPKLNVRSVELRLEHFTIC